MFEIDETLDYTMPAHFGGTELVPGHVATQRVTALVIAYETDRALLEAFVPGAFALRAPEVQVMFATFAGVNWLAGARYNLVNVSAPVRFDGRRDHLVGDYTLVTWENSTEPILRGREQSGVPKVYAEIQDLRVVGPHCSTNASFAGNTFLSLDFESAGPLAERGLGEVRAGMATLNTIGWRYIPRINGPGADLSQFVLFPQRLDLERAETGTGGLRWTVLSWMQHPTQHRIIEGLAALPIRRVTRAMLAEGTGVLDRLGSRVLE